MLDFQHSLINTENFFIGWRPGFNDYFSKDASAGQ